jgi:superfamily I DNA/RNA helicase
MNTEQKLTAEHEGGPLLVVAGPGTGKTWSDVSTLGKGPR